MSPLDLFLLILSLVGRNSGTRVRPVISFIPNWASILPGESVTLTCNLAPTLQGKQRFYWYRDSVILDGSQQNYTIPSAKWMDSGYYQCQINTSMKSDVAELKVSMNHAVLQAPTRINIGDVLSMRCHSQLVSIKKRTVFLKDNNVIQYSINNSFLHLGTVHENTTGTYKCREEMNFISYSSYEKFIYIAGAQSKPVVSFSPIWTPDSKVNSVILTCNGTPPARGCIWYKDDEYAFGDEEKLKAIKLFESGNYQCQFGSNQKSDPINLDEFFLDLWIKANKNFLSDGEHVTLTCYTNLSPARPPTELLYAFYREETNVQGFSSSNTYDIASFLPKDSGNYTCEVQSPPSSVRKRSNAIYIGTDDAFYANWVKYFILAIVGSVIFLSLLSFSLSIFRWVRQRRTDRNYLLEEEA